MISQTKYICVLVCLVGHQFALSSLFCAKGTLKCLPGRSSSIPFTYIWGRCVLFQLWRFIIFTVRISSHDLKHLVEGKQKQVSCVLCPEKSYFGIELLIFIRTPPDIVINALEHLALSI